MPITYLGSMSAGYWHRVADTGYSSKPLVKLAEREFALQAMTLLAIADLPVERREQIERDISRLKVFGIGVGHVMRE